MNLADASKIEIDSVLQACGWRQTKQRVILLKSIFDGNDKHFSISQINETLKDNRSYFSLTTLYENLNTLVDKGYLKQITADKQSFYDTNTTDHVHVFNQEENRIYDYKDYKELHKDLPIPACLALLEEYSLVINIKKSNFFFRNLFQ
tara:strand:- start:206 stop:649 length:444 start_codon:yes stop_codon:yes gene_type:complete